MRQTRTHVYRGKAKALGKVMYFVSMQPAVDVVYVVSA